MRSVDEAIGKVLVSDNLFPIYQLGAEILTSANRTDEAVALLKRGIEVIPADILIIPAFGLSLLKF